MSLTQTSSGRIFSSANLRLFKPFFSREVIFCFVFCQLIWLAGCSLDSVDNRIWPIVILLSLIGSCILCGSRRSYPFILFGMMLLFALGNEVYIRLYYLQQGLAGLNLVTVTPMDISHPLSSSKYGTSETSLSPSSSFFRAGNRYDINRDGYRSPNYPHEKPANTFRIVMVDQCAGEGLSVDYDKCFAALIEKQLNELHLGRHFELVNLSMSGASTANLLYTLKSVAPKYHPDLIMYHLSPRSVVSSKGHTIERYDRQPPRFNLIDVFSLPRFRFFHNMSFAQVAFFPVRANFLPSHLLDKISTVPEKPPVSKVAQMEWVMDTINNSRCSVPVFVYLLKPVQKEGWESLREVSALRAKQYGFGYIDCGERDFGPMDKIVAWPGDAHLGTKGHALHARWMMEALLPFVTDLIHKEDAAKGNISSGIKSGNK